MKKTNRRSFMGKGAAVAAAAAVTVEAKTPKGPQKKVWYPGGKPPEKPSLFNQTISYGNLVFVAGQGAHFEGDIKAHTKHVLDEIEKRLADAGSSMSKVLKAQVYLADMKDYDGMNDVFRGRFGDEPPVRTTTAAAGVPGKSLVEIDVIAYI
jgi:enamine deaminase RidA (YjgF/YER057c/UK114 family)